MHANTRFAFLDEALQFLSDEWAYARLDSTKAIGPANDTAPKNLTHSVVSPVANTNIDNSPTESTPLPPPVVVAPTSAHDVPNTTDIIDPVPHPAELALPNDGTFDNGFPANASDYDGGSPKMGCIMAFLLAEERALRQAALGPAHRQPARELITTTITPWKWGEEEKERERQIAIRAKDKSIVGCAGLAASRWCTVSSPSSQPATATPARDHITTNKTPRKYGGEEKERRQAAARRMKGTRTVACGGLAASRWYSGSPAACQEV